MTSPRRSSNGSFLVIIIVALGILGSGLTVWNYTRHVFSSNRAQVMDVSGTIEAFFPVAMASQIHPHHVARVTMKGVKIPFKAEVISVVNGRIMLQLIEAMSMGFIPGEACSVTIDTTVPAE